MRSTRNKLRLLRGFSRGISNGSGGQNQQQQRHQNHNNHHQHQHQHHSGSSLFFTTPQNLTARRLNSSGNSGENTQDTVVVEESGQVAGSGSVGGIENNNNNPVLQLSSSFRHNRLGKNVSSGPGGAVGQQQRLNSGASALCHECYDLSIMASAEELNSEIRAKAFSICREYLHGAWKQIDPQELVLKRVSGGLSNWLYHCSLPNNVTPVSNEPTQVLLRFYGQVHGEGALESLITESVIFTLLSERKLGPRLYGVFPGGRVEQFIPARPLLTRELRDPELSVLIAQKTAQIHALNIPISKVSSWLWGTMDRWMGSIRENLHKAFDLEDCKEIVQRLTEYNLEGELLWLKRFLPSVGSPVVFSHNDLQEGNILIRPDFRPGDNCADERLVLIDFEYCSYNYRGFDLANHFCEWSYNYAIPTHPNFKFEPSNLPTLEQKMRFVQTYVEVLRREYQLNFSDIDKEFLVRSRLFDKDLILKEIEVFTLASHFFWFLWEYGLSRLESYFQLKQQLELA